eukprot:g19674.t1
MEEESNGGMIRGRSIDGETRPLLDPLLHEKKSSVEKADSKQPARDTSVDLSDNLIKSESFSPAVRQNYLLSEDEVSSWQNRFAHAHFDDQAFAWAFQKESKEQAKQTEQKNASDDALPDEEPVLVQQLSALSASDIYHKYRLRLVIGTWSICLFAISACLIVMSHLLLHRQLGPYSIENILMSASFGIGGLFTWCLNERRQALFWAEVYYSFILLLVIVGVPRGLYELTRNKQRVEYFCEWKTCSDTESEKLLVFAWVSGIIALLTWFILFTVFARVVFVYACAVERVALKRDGRSLKPWIKATAYYLPNYPDMWRSALFFLYVVTERLYHHTTSCCSLEQIGRVFTALGLVALGIIFFPFTVMAIASTFGRLPGFIITCVFFIGMLILSGMLCDKEGTGTEKFWCYIYAYLQFTGTVALHLARSH